MEKLGVIRCILVGRGRIRGILKLTRIYTFYIYIANLLRVHVSFNVDPSLCSGDASRSPEQAGQGLLGLAHEDGSGVLHHARSLQVQRQTQRVRRRTVRYQTGRWRCTTTDSMSKTQLRPL
jgi:hypothetical protein